MKNMFKKKSIKLVVLGVMLIAFAMVQHVSAQNLKTPRVSPKIKLNGTIGVTQVEIIYSSPRVNNRGIWGKLVPYGLTKKAFGPGNPSPWRAGANENTTISFSTDVKIGGKELKAGKYGLHVIVNQSDWVFIFSRNSAHWGSFFYDESADALRVKVTPREVPFKEWLNYGFNNFTRSSGNVVLHWEKLYGTFKIETDIDTLVMKSIEDQLKTGLGSTWRGYYQASLYCFNQNKNLDQGLKWMNKSLSMNENPGNRNMYGYFLVKVGKKDEAEKVFRENVERYSNTPNAGWNVNDSLAEYLANNGKKKEAIKYYKVALEKAPAAQKKRIGDSIKKLEGK
ncbi:MAG: DUF2911 domain-containing protein [bacterium]|nr:DUF2911 domain-containing protein [bacterium]